MEGVSSAWIQQRSKGHLYVHVALGETRSNEFEEDLAFDESIRTGVPNKKSELLGQCIPREFFGYMKDEIDLNVKNIEK